MKRKSKAAEFEPIAKANVTSKSSVETPNVEHEVHTKFVDMASSKRASKHTKTITRRSGRLQGLLPPTLSKEIEVVDEEINVIESDKEDGPQVEQYTSNQTSGEKSFAEKVSWLFQNMEEMNHKEQASEMKYTKYKSLYIESQMKVDALKEENLQLAKKLEFALGKVEAFEKVMGMKEVVFVSELGKSGAVISSSQAAVFGRFIPQHSEPQASPAKTKKRGKGNTCD